MIVEREQEINNFKSISSFKTTALFQNKNNEPLKAELPLKFEKYEDAFQFVSSCKDSSFSIDSLEKKPSKKSPSAPFTTSTLQQEASRKLNYSVSQTMTIAQNYTSKDL